MFTRQPTRSLRVIVRDVAAQIILAVAVGIGASLTFASGVMLLAYLGQSAPVVEDSAPQGGALRT
jgi:hypothetical protein